jgi:hypothetical protein
MELDLTSFSATLAVGLALALIIFLGLRITHPRVAVQVVAWLNTDNADGRDWLPVVGASVILLGIGIMCEDISKNALGERKPFAFAPQLQALLDTERELRCAEFLELEDGNRGHPLCKSNYDDAVDAVPIFTTGLGVRVLEQLGKLYDAHVATPEEADIHEQISSSLTFSDCINAAGKKKKCAKIKPGSHKEISDLFARVYYVAKNTVYANNNYYLELQSIHGRYGFERSIVFVLILGSYAVSFAFLARSTVVMWTDVGGWKTGFSLLLMLLLIVAVIDVTTASESLRNWVCGQNTVCNRGVDIGRGWILPATLLFVVGYRVRRLSKRFGAWLGRSSVSTIPGAPLLAYEREVEAWRLLRLVAILAALLIPASWAYRAEQDYYIQRVLGYYETFRGGALECTSSALCTRKSAANSSGVRSP